MTPLAGAVLAATLAAGLTPGASIAQDGSTYRLTLGDAARLAAERSTPVLEARARTEEAEARVAQSTSDLLPSVDADVLRGARTFNTSSFGLDFPTIPGMPPFFDPNGEVVGPVRSADVRARAQVPLLDLGALGRRRSARAAAEAVRAGEGAAADQAAGAAAQAYLAVLRARADVEARDEDLRLAQDLLDIAHGLVEAGVGVAIDVTRAEAQVATIRAQVLSAGHRSEVSELALRRALRLSDDAGLELADDLEALGGEGEPTEQEAVSQALGSRSDLDVAEAHRFAAREALSATRAGRLPRISASLDDGFYGTWYDNMLNTYSWTFRLSVPLFDGFDRSARIHEQEAQIRELGYRVQDLEEDVAFQVRRAILNLDAAREQAAAAEERLRLAELEVSQEEERVRAGVAGTGDVVRAAMRLNQARTARLDALAGVQAARIAMAAATGTLLDLP